MRQRFTWRGFDLLLRPRAHRRDPNASLRSLPRAGATKRRQSDAQSPRDGLDQLVDEGRQLLTPLCERPATHVVKGKELWEWWKDSRGRVKDVGDSYYEQDGGPTEEELCRELDWLLDDSVAAVRTASGKDWSDTTWKRIRPETSQVSFLDGDVLLREDLVGLHAVWKRRIANREPFQYLTNTSFWMEYVLVVGPGVLIPRPETEVLAEVARQFIQDSPKHQSGAWADLGCGSGALSIALADALEKCASDAVVWAVDKSSVALQYTQENARRSKLSHKIKAVQGTWFDPLMNLKGKLQGIVSNPPYIPQANLQNLQAEVGRHEPILALDGGSSDGLKELQSICTGARDFLETGGFLGLETNGALHAKALEEELCSMRLEDGSRAFHNIRIVSDLAGISRFVIARKNG